MSQKIYNEQNIQDIANKIRLIEGVQRTPETEMLVAEMKTRIDNLIWTGTQLEYDAIAGTEEGYSDTTLYIIFADA